MKTSFQVVFDNVVAGWEVEIIADPERECNWTQWNPSQASGHLKTWQWNGVIGQESPFEASEELEKPEFYSFDCDSESDEEECLDEETIVINFATADITTSSLSPVFYSYDFEEEENDLHNNSVDSHPEYYCLDCDSDCSDELEQTRLDLHSHDYNSSIDDTEVTELKLDDFDSCVCEEEVIQFKLEQFSSPHKSLSPLQFCGYDCDEDSIESEWLQTPVDNKYNFCEYTVAPTFQALE